MNLIQNPTTIPPAQQTLARHEARASESINSLHMATVETFREFWRDRETAESLLAEMGTYAVSAFSQHARAVTFLLQSGVSLAEEDYTPPFAYTAHENGTITLDA